MFESFVGQENAKRILEAEVKNTLKTGKPLPHMIFHGSPGTGKTTLAGLCFEAINATQVTLIGNELNARTSLQVLRGLDIKGYDREGRRLSNGKVVGIAIEEADQMRDSEVWHFPLASCEMVIEGSIYWLPDITVILCTNYLQDLSEPLRSRCPLHIRFDPYSVADLEIIVQNAYPCLDKTLVHECAVRCQSTPRIALNYARSCQVSQMDFFKFAGIDERGLTALHREYLRLLEEHGTLSLSSLSGMLRIPRDQVLELEGVLLSQGLCQIESRGRSIAGLLEVRGRKAY